MIKSIVRWTGARGGNGAGNGDEKVESFVVEPLEERAYMSATGGPVVLDCDIPDSASTCKYYAITLTNTR